MSRRLASTQGIGRGFFPLDGRSRESAEEAGRAREAERQSALRLLTQADDEARLPQRAALPTLATAGDVREVVRFLKRRPAGVSIVEALDEMRRRIFEPRKVAAYEFWGLLSRTGGRLRLTPLGLEFARRLEPERTAYRELIERIEPYHAALEWMKRQERDLFTFSDVANFWREAHTEALDEGDAKTIEASVVCFFHLCQAAELGAVTIGKRGQPARLRVEREELELYLEACVDAPPNAARQRDEGAARERDEGKESAPMSSTALTTPARETTTHAHMTAPETLRLYLSCRADVPVVGQILTALELTEIESRVAPSDCAARLPACEEVLRAMRDCNAGLFIITPEACTPGEAGRWRLKEDVLAEICAAFILYERRVLLLLDERLTPPVNLTLTPHFTFNDAALTWEQGITITKAIKDLRPPAPPR